MGQDAKPAKATGFRYLLGYVVIQILLVFLKQEAKPFPVGESR